MRIYSLVVIVFVAMWGGPADAAECLNSTRADQYPDWEYIKNNAVRTADEYATMHNPKSTFIFAKVDVIFQYGGEHKDSYLVRLLAGSKGKTSFAMLKPNFPMCGDPVKLDDSRSDLFSVVSAKFNGLAY